MEFLITPEFDEAYQAISDREIVAVDRHLARLLSDPTTAWARQSRLDDGTWICRFRTRDFDYRVSGTMSSPIFSSFCSCCGARRPRVRAADFGSGDRMRGRRIYQPMP